MLGKIIRHEARILVRDRTLWALAVFCALFVGYAVSNGASWSRAQRTAGERLAAKGWQQVEELRRQLRESPGVTKSAGGRDPSDPYAVGTIAQSAFLPQGPLAGLAIGQSDVYPQNVRVVIYTTPQEAFDEGSFKSPLSMALGRFDLAFVIVFLLPLLIIALTYNLLSSEREQGTLRLLLSQPVRLREVVLGKILLRAIVIYGLILGFSLAAFSLAGFVSWGAGFDSQLWWMAVVIVYGTFWFSLGIAVSSLGLPSATNAVVLVSLWITLVVVIPTLVNLAATIAFPAPPRTELINALRASSYDIRRDSNRLLGFFYEDHPDMAPPGFRAGAAAPAFSFAKGLLIVGEKMEEGARPVVSRFEKQLVSQQELVSRLRFLTPALVVQEALNDIAGTGVVRYQRFRVQVAGFQAAWKRFFTPRVFRDEHLRAGDYDLIPRFVFTEEPAGQTFARVAAGLAGIVLPALVLAAAGLRRLGRYPVDG